MCETSLEESNMFDNEVCDFLDATMGVVADFASMLANGIYLFSSFRYCPDFTSTVAFFSFHCPGSHMLSESVGRTEKRQGKFQCFHVCALV